MRYKDFIGEIEQLANDADDIAASDMTHESPRFREWRYRTESLVEQVGEHGYRLPGTFGSFNRAYRAMYPNARAYDDSAAFKRDITDAAVELRHFIDHYRKYGQPDLVNRVNEVTTTLSSPDRVTIAWLFAHVPVRTWALFASVLLAAFLIGVGVGSMGLKAWLLSLFNQ